MPWALRRWLVNSSPPPGPWGNRRNKFRSIHADLFCPVGSGELALLLGGRPLRQVELEVRGEEVEDKGVGVGRELAAENRSDCYF